MPVVFFDEGYWRGVVNFDALVDSGVVNRADIDLITFVKDGRSAWAALKGKLEMAGPGQPCGRQLPLAGREKGIQASDSSSGFESRRRPEKQNGPISARILVWTFREIEDACSGVPVGVRHRRACRHRERQSFL